MKHYKYRIDMLRIKLQHYLHELEKEIRAYSKGSYQNPDTAFNIRALTEYTISLRNEIERLQPLWRKLLNRRY